MQKQDQVYELIKRKVGLKEDRNYQKLFDSNNIWGEALRPLALRHFKRFIAVLYYLIVEENKQFDLILGAGDSGIWLAKIVELLYQKLNLKPPVIITLPIVRFKFTYIKYEGQPLDLFDNSILVPEAEKQLKELEKLENILYVDDEIANGVTSREAVRVVLKATPKGKIAKNINLSLVAEDQAFNPNDFLQGVTVTMYPFAKEVPGIHGVINYIVPWDIEKQIKEYFSEEEAGAKVRVNMLLDLPSKDKELKEKMFIPKPIFIYDYNEKATQKIPNFTKLQSEFKDSLNRWIDEAIEEYETKTADIT